MKINLNYQFKTLSGKEMDRTTPNGDPIEANNMSKLLASCMWLSSEKNMKFKFWAEDLYKTGSLDADEVDLELIVAWVEIYGTDQNKPYAPDLAKVGIKGQIIDIIKKQRDKQKDKK